MEIKFLIRLLRMHWVFLTVLTTVATLGGLLATYVIDEEYEASTKILLRPEQEINFNTSSKAMMDYPLSFNSPPETISRTYAEIMVSTAVAARVVDVLQLHTTVSVEDSRWYMRELYRARDWVKLTAKNTWEFLQYGRIESEDPYWSAVKRIERNLSADPINDSYIFTLTATLGAPGLAARVANTAAEVFVEYSRTARQGEEGSAVQLIGESLAEVRADLDAARLRLDEFRIKAKAASLEQELSLKLTALSNFESDLENARRDLAGLQQTHKESHSKTRSAVAQIQSLERSIQWYRKDISALDSHQGELARLELELQVLQDSYELVSRRHEEARMAAVSEISEIRVLHPAVPPLYPVGPIKIYYAGGGFFVGLLLGITYLLLREYAEQRLNTQEDVEESLGIPVLAIIPHARFPRRSAAVLAEPGVSPAWLAWNMLAGNATPARPGEAAGEN